MNGVRIFILVFVFFLHCDGLIPRKCLMTPGADKDELLGKTKCYYCMRTLVLYMDSVTQWKTIHEEAGCADEIDPKETPPGLDCASHLGKNSSGRGSDFVMYFTAREDTELVARRCCENFDGDCNRPFQVKYPQKYMLRHIKRSPPKLMGIFILCIVLLVYYVIRIYWASRFHRQMSLDVTKKEQMKMFGYKDDPLEQTIIENKTKVEEPNHAVRKSAAFGKFNDVLRAIFDIQYYLNPKKYDAIWMQSLPKMRKIAEMRGLKKPVEIPPPRILPIPERTGAPFYELKRNPAHRTGIFAEILKHLTVSYKFAKTQNRPVPSCLPDLVLKLIEHGPYEYPFTAAELFQVFDKAKDQFSQDQTVLQLKNNQIVIGDIRGRYVDLFRFFNAFGWPPQRSYLFLGGIIENEEDQSLECMALLAALKTTMPNYIFILRGVGETVPYVPGRRFPGRKGEVIGNSLARLCNSLPLAAVINSRILCTHSGVTTHFKGKSRLNNIQRPFNIEDMTEAGRRIIFAVPETNCRMFRMRPHEKNGEVFGSKAVQKTLANMKLDLLIRSRSQINDGFCLHWDNTVLSIWSALTHGVTRTAAVEIDPNCRIALHLMDTLTTLTLDKNLRMNTNNVKAVAEELGGEEEDEEEDGDDEFVEEKEESSRRKVKEAEEKPRSKEESARAVGSAKEEVKANEMTASGKSGEGKKESGGASKEKTTMKDSKDSKEGTKETATKIRDVHEKEEGLNNTQDSLSARAHEAAFSDSMMEQKTQSVKEWKENASNKKGKKKKEEYNDKDLEKTPDISLRSQKEMKSLIQLATPTKDDGKSGKKKKVVEKEYDDAILKSKYEDAIPKIDKEDPKKKDTQNESVMKDVSVRRKEGIEKDEKHPVDSLRDGAKVDEKTKKKSNETLNEGPSKETEKEAHPKEEYAISEKSLGSKTHKTAKKVKKEEKKEKKDIKEVKKEKKDEKEEKKEEKDEKK